MHRTWLPLIVLVVSSLVGDALTRTNANGVDRERQLQAATEAIRNLPATFGPWRSVPAEPVSENALRILQCRAHASLSFVNDETGERVSVVLMAGTAGPMLAHTPKACYESGSFEIVEAARAESISSSGGQTDAFEKVTFRPKSGGPAWQRMYHAWRKSQGRWEAPRNPRLALGGEPMLYKLQLATNVAEKSADDTTSSDACRRLLEALIPVLDRMLNNPS
jgi:hypothetical protein